MADTSQALEMGAIAIPSPTIPHDTAKRKGIAEKIIYRHEIAARSIFDKLKLESLRNGFTRTTEYQNGTSDKMTQLAMRLPDGTKVSVTTEEKDNFGKLSGSTTTVLELGTGLPRILMLHQPTNPIELKKLEKDVEYWDLSVNEEVPLPIKESHEFVNMLKDAIPDIPATNEYMQRNIELNGGKSENERNQTKVRIQLARDMSLR